MPSASPGVMAAVVALLPTLYPDDEVLVCYGAPGSYQPDIIISLGDVRTISTRPVHGTARPREETSELDLTFSVYQAGDESVQVLVMQKAYELRNTFADHFKTKPNETLGGACREAWVTGDDYTPDVAINPADPDTVAGRVATLTSTLTFVSRV